MFELVGALVCMLYVIRLLNAWPGVFSSRKSVKRTFGAKVAVTGCTDGIGKEWVRQLVKARIPEIVAIGRNQAKLDELQKEMAETAAAAGGSPTTLKTFRIDFDQEDLSHADNWKEYKAALATCTSVVNCAGVSYPGAMYFHEVPIELINTLVNVNVLSTFLTAQAVYRSARAANNGSLMFMGSGASVIGEPMLAAYSGTKGVVEGLGQALHNECLKTDVGVQVQVPLMITSKMSKIRKPSLLVPSLPQYVKLSLRATCYASNGSMNNRMNPTVSPYWAHMIACTLLNAMPRYLKERVSLSSQKVLRRKYLAKVKATTVEAAA